MIVLLAVVATLVADCDDGSEPAKTPVREVAAAGSGVVRGVVKFSAPRPVAKVIGGECCDGATAVMDESTVVNDDGTLKNVVVYIKDGPNVANAVDAVVLDQKNCQYVPHLLAMRTGQPLDVTSHDPTMHNVHVLASNNPAVNFSETAVGAVHRLMFSSPEMIHIKCDVHPWMSAYVAVFDHPFFAVTGADGKFEIGRLPKGQYTLVAWHEKYGELEQAIRVDEGGKVDLVLEYKGF